MNDLSRREGGERTALHDFYPASDGQATHARRSCRYGSFTTWHSLSKIIVGRSASEYAGHRGIASLLGLPERAKVSQVRLIFSASAKRVDESPVSGALSSVSKTNGISRACGDLSRPPRTGVSQVNR